MMRTIKDAHATNQGTVCKMWCVSVQCVAVCKTANIRQTQMHVSLQKTTTTDDELQKADETRDSVCCRIIRAFDFRMPYRQREKRHERQLIWPMEGVKLPG